MKFPGRKNLIISREKLTDYLLSETHATGKFKARFFRNLGFNENNVNLFENAIQKIAKQPIKEESTSPFGVKYVIDGEIETPTGKIVQVRTVWIIEKGQKNARFITIYPV